MAPSVSDYQNVLDLIAKTQQAGNPLVGDLSAATKQVTAEQQAQQQLDQQQSYANSLKDQAAQFRSNLPQYTQPQIEAAGEQARNNLASDIQGVKSDANARGLLFSGVNAGNQNMAKANESAKLGQNIQNINQQANSAADQLDQLTNNAMNSTSQNQLSFAQLQEQAEENSYSQALQAQQQQQGFFSDLFKGIAGIPATVALAGK